MLSQRHQDGIKKLNELIIGNECARYLLATQCRELAETTDPEIEGVIKREGIYDDLIYIADLLCTTKDSGAYEGHTVVCIKDITLETDKYEVGDKLTLGTYDWSYGCDLYEDTGGEYWLSWEDFNNHFVITVE